MNTKEDYDLVQQILPLLISQPNNLVKHEIIAIVEAINRWHKCILELADNEKTFFASFVALCGHCIISNAQQIPKSLLSSASSACNVILQYILHEITDFEEKSVLSKVCIVWFWDQLLTNFMHTFQHQLIGMVQGLCEDIPPLLKSDIIALSVVLKSSPIPESMVCHKSDTTSSHCPSHPWPKTALPKSPNVYVWTTRAKPLSSSWWHLLWSLRPKGTVI